MNRKFANYLFNFDDVFNLRKRSINFNVFSFLSIKTYRLSVISSLFSSKNGSFIITFRQGHFI